MEILEVDKKVREVKEIGLCCEAALSKETQKQHVWKKITCAVNRACEYNQTTAYVEHFLYICDI